MSARRELEPGLVLAGRYHLRMPLGSGGAGAVWCADDDVLGRPVAVKLLHPELERDTSAVARFRREATSAAALTHPNAVIVYDIGEDAGRIFLVMEMVDGPTLGDLLRLGPLPAAEVTALGGAVSRALGAAHDRDLVHRDVKPGNVLLTREGIAKMADFGIATALGDAQARLTTPGMVVGTSTYLAPEQLSGDAVDGRADIYSLGLVLHECLTGEPAFSGGTAVEVATRRLAGDVPPPSSRITGIPEELDLVVQRATRRDPDQRWDHGADLAAALLALAPDDATRRLAELVERRVGPAPSTPAAAPPPAPTTPPPSDLDERPTSVVDRPRPQGGGDADSTTAIPATTGVGAASGWAQAPSGTATASTGADRTGTLPARWEEEPVHEPQEPVVRSSGARRWRPLVLGLLVVALLGFAVTGLLDGDAVLDANPDRGQDAGGEQTAIEPAAASDFDPYSSDGEHPEDIANVHDGDPDTTWQTQRYNSAALGNLKPGVGLYLDLGQPATVRELGLSLAPEGASLEIYAGESEPATGDGFDPAEWGQQVAALDGAGADTVVEVDEVEQRYWLVWFTSLPNDGGGHRVSVSELSVRG